MLHGKGQRQEPQPRVAALRACSVDIGEGEGGQVPPQGGLEGGGQADTHLEDTEGVLQRQKGARFLGTQLVDNWLASLQTWPPPKYTASITLYKCWQRSADTPREDSSSTGAGPGSLRGDLPIMITTQGWNGVKWSGVKECTVYGSPPFQQLADGATDSGQYTPVTLY